MKIFKNKKVVIITATVLVVLAVGITAAIAVDKGTTRSGKKVKTAKISSEMKAASSESVYVTEQTEAGEPVAAEMTDSSQNGTEEPQNASGDQAAADGQNTTAEQAATGGQNTSAGQSAAGGQSASAAGNAAGSKSNSDSKTGKSQTAGGKSNSADQSQNQPSQQPASQPQEQPKPQKEQVQAGWLYYGSKAGNGMTGEQKAYLDSVMKQWTNGELSDSDVEDILLQKIANEWGLSAMSAGVDGNHRYISKSLSEVPNGNWILEQFSGIYDFEAIYTKGEYDEYGNLIYYSWSAGIL
mgnify:CR=1 FL=1